MHVRKVTAVVLSIATVMANGYNVSALDIGDGGIPIINWDDIDKNETYDILVDGSLSQDDPSNNVYTTLQAAYEAASAGTAEKSTIIAIKPNVYNLAENDVTGDERKEQVGFGIYKDYITFVGLSDNPNDVVIADNRGLNAGASSNYNSSTVAANCTGLTMQNITILNYCNIDYTYNLDSSKNLTKRTSTETQAFAFSGDGDKHLFDNCRFVSLLDTSWNGAARSLYNNCYVQGTNDFIMGGDTQVYNNCTIKALANHIIGGGIGNAVFIDTTFLIEKDSSIPTYICKGESPTTLINCTIPVSTNPMQWMPTLPNQKRFYYYNLKDTTGAKGTITDDSCAIELNAEQAKSYNLWNLLRGSDDWDPMGVKAENENDGNLAQRVVISPSSESIITSETTATFTATVKPQRASETVTWSSEGDVELAVNGNTVVVSGKNETKENTTATIKATIGNGLYEVATVTVAPKTEEAPKFTSMPVINAPVDGVIKVDYTLDLGDRTDTSVISWYRCDDQTGANPVLVADTKYDTPCKSFVLGKGEVGKYMMVSIAPKNDLSVVGATETYIYNTPIADSDVPSKTISTNFLNVPTHPPFITASELGVADDAGVLYRNKLVESIPNTVKGKWNFIGDWYYNYGINDASAVMGVITGTRYGRLIYSQVDGTYGDMKVTLSLYPEKTNNTGFGSAGQYQEVVIKYDPNTQTGYGVRYERTTQDAKSAFVTLYKYENGTATPISDTVQTTALRSECILILKAVGDKLSVHMESSKNIDLPNGSIDISATITPNNFGSVGIYHTGTVSGGNRTLIKNAEILYDDDASKEEEKRLKGDADGDGKITANDSSEVLQYAQSNDGTAQQEWLDSVDVDNDGIVTANDSAFILQKALDSSYEL